MIPTEGQVLLNISEAADLLNVSKVTIRRWTNDGKLACFRVGSRKERRFLEADLRKLISTANEHKNSNAAGQPGTHRCVLCDGTQLGWDVITQEIVSQLSLGAHVTFIGDAARKKRLANSLATSTCDLKAIMKAGQLRQLSVEQSYLLSGTFCASRAAAFVESTILDGKSKGFDRTLFVGWSGWLAEPPIYDMDSLALTIGEYEHKLNDMIARYPLSTVLCPYATSELPPAMLFELAAHHPQIQLRSQRVYGLDNSALAR